MNSSAPVRLILISTMAIFAFILVLFALRLVGLSHQHQPLSLSELDKSPLWFCVGGQTKDGLLKNSKKAFEACLKKDRGAIPFIELQRTKEGKFVVLEKVLLEKISSLTGPSYIYNLKQLQEAKWHYGRDTEFKSSAPIIFDELAPLLKDRPFALNLSNKDPAQFEGLPRQLKKLGLEEKVIFYSLYKDTIKYMRKELPRALFAINTHQMGQAMVMNSLFVEPFAGLHGDLIMSPFQFGSQKLFSPRLLEEIERRKLKVYLFHDPDADAPLPQWLSDKVSGWVY